ncbi:efflux RND transporter periplasmic adaptor subunit [Erythrobacter litoralis]|uniref:efflux RND transporter periplasmic adaptor subunit n=1 Tax=Erythrobacter litoralis TaxID=39960 RepID=UPI00243529E5|nr:efflux RND transporter periplasmic adaptor subunit [Erythrobacter litoralis]MDG6079521.1 efflux RND transporter periplasmic adaptor subunit [Erythrobacter litoralis]
MTYETGIDTDKGRPLDIALGDEPADVDERPRTNRRTWIVGGIVILAVFLALLAYYLSSQGGAAETENGSADQVPTVSVVAPGRTTVEGEITATGTIAARRELPVGVVGEGGRVVSVPVDAGDWVRQGQVLAVIDRSVQNQQSQAATAQIRVAQADADLAQANLDRALKLVDRGFISDADVDRLTATRDAAVARVRVAQAQAGELNARNARLNITAPAAGLVLSRDVEPGATVGAGSAPLFTIAQGGQMELLARLGENELARVSAGAMAQVTPVGTDKTFTGQVWQIAPTIDAQDRQGTARIALSYAPELRPGGFANAVLRSGTVVAPILPESALQSDDEGSYVYIVGQDNTVARRRVTLGNVTPDGIVIADGLNGQERVVLRAGGFLNEGDTVKPSLERAAAR